MSIWGRIRNLDLREFVTLSKIFLKNPRYFYPTLKATTETIKICDYKFGDKHHFENPTNAFRHSYWNYLICAKCFSISGSVEKAMEWAKTITDLHEDLSPNDNLARAMDLHNNRIGREIFLKYQEEIPDADKVLRKMMAEAKHVKSLEEIKSISNQMVFIEK